MADYLEVGYADEQQEQAALAWLVSTTLTAVLPHEGMLPGDLSSLVPEFSSVSFVIAAGRAEPGPLLRFDCANLLVIGVQGFWHRHCANCLGPFPWRAQSAIPALGVEASEAVPCFHRLLESSLPDGPSIHWRS